MKISVFRSLLVRTLPSSMTVFLAFPPVLSHPVIHQASFLVGTDTEPLMMLSPDSIPCTLHNLTAQKRAGHNLLPGAHTDLVPPQERREPNPTVGFVSVLPVFQAVSQGWQPRAESRCRG